MKHVKFGSGCSRGCGGGCGTAAAAAAAPRLHEAEVLQLCGCRKKFDALTILEVLEHFGAEAPALLNNYACAVEDALIEQVGRNSTMNLMLDAASEERAAMNHMLTDPDVLADYVNGFFGPEGPYPTLTAAEQAEAAEVQAREQFAQEIQQQEERGVPTNFQRPVMDMPTPGRQQSSNNDFWANFSAIMDSNPENAYQMLSQAGPQAFQSKMLVQDF